MKPLKPTLSIAELQKTIDLWKSRKITDSVIPKLLRLYLGMTAYMNQEKVYPVENFYELSIALAFKNARFLAEAVKRCGSFGITPEKNIYGMKLFYSPLVQVYAYTAASIRLRSRKCQTSQVSLSIPLFSTPSVTLKITKVSLYTQKSVPPVCW